MELSRRLLIKRSVSGRKEYRGPLAQLAEQLILNQQVPSSSLGRLTTPPPTKEPLLKYQPLPPYIPTFISLYILKTAQVGSFRASVPLALLGLAAAGGVGEPPPEMALLGLPIYSEVAP